MLGEYLGAWSSTTKVIYRMNGDANDSSGNSNNWTATNISWVDWRFLQAASFNGSTSKIVLWNNLWIIWWSITMSTWIKLWAEIWSWIYCIIQQWDSSSNVANLIFYEYNWWTRRLFFDRARLWVVDEWFYYNITLWTTNRYNIIYSYNWTTLRWYLNWVDIWNHVASWNWSTSPGNSLNLWMWYDWTNFPYNWLHDETIVENVAWGSEYVKRYYTYAKWRFGIL